MNYTVIIKYQGRYFIQKESKNSSKFEFPTFKLCDKQKYSAKDFMQSNIDIKKVIAAEIIHKTPFRNSSWTGENAYKAVSLRRIRTKNDQNEMSKIKLVIFTCNEMRNDKKNEFVPYVSDMNKWCTQSTKRIIRRVKFQNNWSTYLFYAFLFVMFLQPGDKFPFNADALPFVYSALGGLVAIFQKMALMDRCLEKYNNCPFLSNIPLLFFLLFVGMFLVSLCLSFLVPDTWSPVLTKVGLLVLILESAVEVFQREV